MESSDFPLLFYKRICDVYDEELAEALEESGGDHKYAQLPEQHRFQIPEDAHWKVIRTHIVLSYKAFVKLQRV